MKNLLLFAFLSILCIGSVQAQKGVNMSPTCFQVSNMTASDMPHNRALITFDVFVPQSMTGYAEIRTNGHVITSVYVSENTTIMAIVTVDPEDASQVYPDGTSLYYFECGVESSQCESSFDGCSIPIGGE